jgi:hypothetical protein
VQCDRDVPAAAEGIDTILENRALRRRHRARQLPYDPTETLR